MVLRVHLLLMAFGIPGLLRNQGANVCLNCHNVSDGKNLNRNDLFIYIKQKHVKALLVRSTNLFWI